MSTQGIFKNIKERLWKPSKKRQKLGEEEDDWCDALNYLSLDSDDEYFDAPEQQVTSISLHKKRKRKIGHGKELPENKFEKKSEMHQPRIRSYTAPSTPGVRSRRTYGETSEERQHQIFPRPLTSGDLQFGVKDSCTSSPMKTDQYHFAAGGSNTATSSSSKSDVRIGPKQSAAIDDQPRSQLPRKDYKYKGKLEKRKVTVTLMTSWHLSSIEGLQKKLITLQRFRPDLIEAVKVIQLPFSGLHDYTVTEDVDIIVLCHSIVNRRFGITNVTDSLYDEFLDHCNKKLGKERIVVIAHDFRQEKDEVRAVTMNTFKHTQWSTFEKAGLVMICGMMDKTPEIQEKDWKSLEKFLEDASKSTPTIADISQTTHLKKGTSDTKRKPFETEKENKDSNISSKSLGTSPSRAGGMKTRSRKPVIYICTSWGLHSIRGLKEKLKTLLEKSLSRYEIRELQLPYSRLEDYKFPSEVDSSDAMILCHSVQNRGFSITDVQNSIYDEFLKLCNRVFGRGRMAVIVHDFEDKPEILKVRLETIRRTQPTTYELADCVALAGLLDDPDVKLCHDKSTSLETFVKRLF